MLTLFEGKIGPMGKQARTRSALWSVMLHAGVITLLLWLGLSPARMQLPDQLSRVFLAAPPVPAPPPPPAPLVTAAVVQSKRTVRVFASRLTAPVTIPARVAIGDVNIEAPPELAVAGGVPGGIPGGVEGGVPGGMVGGIPALAPPATPPPAQVAAAKPPEPPPAPKRIQVSSEVQEAMILSMTRPEYPLGAKLSRVHGEVRLKAIIDREGRITELKLISGHPLLAPAALAAVEKWRYRPTVLNGVTVEVSTEVTVVFRLT
jgi:periplasmic protein TonB